MILKNYVSEWVLVHRFVKHFLHSHLQRLVHSFLVIVGSKRNHVTRGLFWALVVRLKLKDLLCGFESVHDGHIDVHHYEFIFLVLAVWVWAARGVQVLREFLDCVLPVNRLIYNEASFQLSEEIPVNLGLIKLVLILEYEALPPLRLSQIWLNLTADPVGATFIQVTIRTHNYVLFFYVPHLLLRIITLWFDGFFDCLVIENEISLVVHLIEASELVQVGHHYFEELWVNLKLLYKEAERHHIVLVVVHK